MTDITTAREEIQAQRDALMVGTHVRHYPRRPGEGCLVTYREKGGKVKYLQKFLSWRAVEWAAARIGHPVVSGRLSALNDHSPGLTASQAIAILDEALLVLKDYEAGLA